MKLQTRTKTGTKITLESSIREYLGDFIPAVKVSGSHPKIGKFSFEGTWSIHSAAITGSVNGTRLGVAVPKADYQTVLEAAKKDAIEIAAKRLDAIKTGTEKITVKIHHGEILSGYIVIGKNHDAATVLLKEIGLAKDVLGWGTCVSEDAIKALGEEFTYAQALEFATPAINAKEAKEKAIVTARQEKFDEAKKTQKPVVINSWITDECTRHSIDCSFDQATTYALPNGTTKTTYTCCH